MFLLSLRKNLLAFYDKWHTLIGYATHYLTIRLRARVFYEQIVNEAQPSWLSLVENSGS